MTKNILESIGHRLKFLKGLICMSFKDLVISMFSRFSLNRKRMTQIFTDRRASASSAQSVFHRIPSAFICVHLRLIFVSLSDRTRKIQFKLFPIISEKGFMPVKSGILSGGR
jgi:hypothetical protein